MRVELETNKNLIQAMEQQISEVSTDDVETKHSLYFFNTETKSAISFTRVVGGVQIKVAENKQDRIEILDEMEREVTEEGFA